MNAPVVSVVIPAFGRLEPLKFTLRSAAAAARAFAEPVEILVVDDGSSPPLADVLVGFDAGHPVTILRQLNSGSIIARRTGLRAARGDYLLFLDSDDLIHPDKLRLQIPAMRATAADVSYSDMARVTLGPDYSALDYTPAARLAGATTAHALFLRVQPLPHSPVYRRDYLARALADPIVPVERRMDPVGDVWLYYNLAPFPARIVHVEAPLSAIGPHEEERFSRHWEKLSVAALHVAETFARHCPDTPATLAARQEAGVTAFDSWRRLPRGYHPEITARTLGIWRRLPRAPRSRLGGPLFQSLARLFGPVAAGRILRLRNHTYASCRTLGAADLEKLLLHA